MGFIEINAQGSASFRQRWSHYLAILVGLVGLFIGVNLRDIALYSTTLYNNTQAGIRAEYPQNWLLDEEGDYIFRVRNTTEPGFNTTIQVAALPVSTGSSPTNILNALTLDRAQTLSAYTVLDERPYPLPNEVEGTAMSYIFVETDPNPFLQGVPVVVEGLDILTIARGQAIIITFLTDADTYAENLPILEQFMSTLEFG
jgi:hypothetical protein